MLKINGYQYIHIEEKILEFYDRRFRSYIYKYIDGDPPALNLFEIYRNSPGKEAVYHSSHRFFIRAE